MNNVTIKAFRKTHQITQTELAVLLDSKLATVSSYETGRYKMSDWFKARLQKLIDKMGIDEELLADDPDYMYIERKKRKKGSKQLKIDLPEPVGLETEVIKPLEKAPHSEHYGDEIDVIAWAEANLSDEELIGFYRVSAIKYAGRFGFKEGKNIKDLDKAEFFVQKLKKYAD